MIETTLIYVIVTVLLGTAGLFFRVTNGNSDRFIGRAISVVSILFVTGFLIMAVLHPTPIQNAVFMWKMPFASFATGIDWLSMFFLVPLLILTASSSLYGSGYMAGHSSDRGHWLQFSLLTAGMVLVLLARNALLFLIAWELMSLSSFFLVITDRKNESSIRAGWIYFVTTHLGTAFLIVLFFMFAAISGSFDFSAWRPELFTGRTADVIFILSLFAFGLKAGFIPFHVWLPLAHPAAPSHVSALMSGIMIKMGIYGIIRVLLFISPFHAWWGGLLIVLGAVSGILGVLFAIGQHDIKQLLAYHSVENIGIILLGIGLGVAGVAYGSPLVALFGFAGGLLHVVNHSLFKSILFFGAGAVIRQTGTGHIDRMGGLIRSMPKTAAAFLIGAIAICGLPFFNGFISECFIYTGSIRAAVFSARPQLALLAMTVLLSLGLIGGLAAACFAKVFGVVFLGEPRLDTAEKHKEASASMVTGMWILVSLCVIIGLGSPLVVPLLVKPVFMLLPAGSVTSVQPLFGFSLRISAILFACIGVVVVVSLVRILFDRGKSPAGSAPTWDCGYVKPDASMQYTASSFADPIIHFFRLPLAAKRSMNKTIAPLPGVPWIFSSSVDDWFLSRIFSPMVSSVKNLFSLLHWFQSGKSQLYILYIALTVLGLILWKYFL